MGSCNSPILLRLTEVFFQGVYQVKKFRKFQGVGSKAKIALRKEAGYGYFLGLHDVTDRIDPRIDPKMKWLEGNRSNPKCCSFQFGVNNERDFLFFYGLLLFEKKKVSCKVAITDAVSGHHRPQKLNIFEKHRSVTIAD